MADQARPVDDTVLARGDPDDRSGEQFDVIVVGGGPAGATAARMLGGTGRRVLLLERESLPRYKPCGGGLGPKTLARLPFPIEDLPHVRLERIEFRLRGDSPVTWDLPAEFPFYMVMRADFDHRLVLAASEAGAEVRTGEAVRSVRWAGDRFMIETDHGRYDALYVVGADGASSVVRHSLGVEPRQERGVALECEVEVPDRVYAPYARTAVFDVEAAPDGYGWIFPKATHLSVGLGSMKPARLPLRPLLQQFILRYGLATAEAAGSLTVHAHPLPVATEGERAHWGNALLVGDAVGVADGFGGEGICYSMASGELAAGVVTRALEGDIPALDGYEAALDRLIRRDHRQANLMGQIVRRFPDAGYRILTSIGEGKTVLIPLLLGKISFGEALRRLPRLMALDRSEGARDVTARREEDPLKGRA